NDFHSNFEQWPRVAGYLKDAKAKKTEENESCWIVDGCDHGERVPPIDGALMEKDKNEVMTDDGNDLATLGNNEGITLAHDDLYHLYDDARFHVVCANLQSMTTDDPGWLQPTVQIESVHGVNIGVIGLTVPFNAFYHLLDWHVESPY